MELGLLADLGEIPDSHRECSRGYVLQAEGCGDQVDFEACVTRERGEDLLFTLLLYSAKLQWQCTSLRLPNGNNAFLDHQTI